MVAEHAAPQLPMEQSHPYKIILFNGEGTDVLLQQQCGELCLPEITIPQFMRPAERITSLLLNLLGMPTVLLFSHQLEASEKKHAYAVLESCTTSKDVPPGFIWVLIDTAVSLLIEATEASLVQSCHRRVVQPCFGTDPAPFSRLGWVHRLQEWILIATRSLGTRPTDLLQLNGSETFSLVRFETTGKPLWFKAVGPPNLHEFPITRALWELFPSYLPAIVAFDPLLNGWLMEDEGHSTLRDISQMSAWQMAVQRFADLQIESIPEVSNLLERGCRDLRIDTLSRLVDPFFQAMIGLMKQQTKDDPPPLTASELASLACTVWEGLRRLRETNTPETLGHSDFNPGNILMNGDRCVFIDWAEAHVSHPFLTFEFLRVHLHKHPQLSAQDDELREAYSRSWLSVISLSNLDRAFEFSPLVSIFAHALSNNGWRNHDRSSTPGAAGYLRSLARMMKREAELLPHRRHV